MHRTELVLACLSTAPDDSFTPVQIQKLLYIIDRELSEHIGGPYFNFKPYDYGPYDKDIYNVLEELIDHNCLSRNGSLTDRSRSYQVTHEGEVRGSKILSHIDSVPNQYIVSVSQFVRKCSFSELVSAVYNAYPEMKVNSVFG